MIIKSEKESYQDEFREIQNKYDEDIFFWGEDLLDKHLVLYSGKIKELPDYLVYSKELVNSGIIIINIQKGKALKCITSRYNPSKKEAFLQDDAFNALWVYLKRSISQGIRRQKQLNENYDGIESPEDVIDFSRLRRKNSDPIIEKDRIVYKPRQQSAEKIRIAGARQSAIDNQKNLYFYARYGGLVHDRECEDLKVINDEDFVGSSEFPAEGQYCKKCMRVLFVRMGCAPNTKEIPACNRFLTKHGVKTSQLQKLVGDHKIHFHCKAIDEMIAVGVEDTWKIRVLPSGKLELWHNNYVKTSPTERYFTDGFHNQNLENPTLRFILNFIAEYSWEKHLLNEATKISAKEEEKLDTIKDVPIQKESRIEKLVQWIRSIFKI